MSNVKDYRWAQAYLGGVRSLRHRLRYLDGKIMNLRDEIMTRGGVDQDVRVQTSKKKDALENMVIRYIDELARLQEGYQQKYIELCKRQDEAMDRIACLKDGRCKELLIRYYIEWEDFVSIAADFGYIEPGSIYGLHRRALQYFAEVANANGWEDL